MMVLLGRFDVAKIGLALLFALATGYAFAATVPIANTKHNLSSTSANTIKSNDPGAYANQICVFCHTPHFAMTAQPLPLWNKQLTSATYTTYTSDYLTSLGYPTAAPFTAGQSSRTCLSCHDGTVAVGAVYNVNGTAGAGTFSMANVAPVTFTMPVAAAGYLGTNLADDHPVGYEYKPGGAYPPVPGQITDPELKAWPLASTTVKLDPNLATGKVECKSCHDPHDNQFQKFLRASKTNGELCKICHNKVNYAASGHDLSTQAYNQIGDTGKRVTDYSCLACHRPHSGVGTPLLRGAEQVTCYEEGCHGPNNTWSDAANVTVGSLNIQPEMGKTDAHPTNATSGKHKDIPGGESVTQLSGIGAANRHAECYDCHNPHQVQPVVGKSTRGTLRISAALKGTWGVEPIWPAAPVPANNAITFAAPASFTKVNPATDEYQVCLKCHSNYVTLPAGARNLAEEINPRNSSYHGIVPLIGAPYPIIAATQQNNATNFFVNQNTMVQPWAGDRGFLRAEAESCRLDPTQAQCVTFAASRGRVWCSDCHNSNAAVAYPSPKSATIPSGPHGSTNGVGTIPGTAPVTNSDKMLIDTIATQATSRTPLCLRCHTTYNGGNANSRNALTRGHGTTYNMPEGCFGCHMLDVTINVTDYVGSQKIYPHGMNKKWAVAVGGVAATGHMGDAFFAGRQRMGNFSAKTCNPGPTVNDGGCNTSRSYF